MAEVIQQYLIELGAKADEPAWKKFTEAVKVNKVLLLDLGLAAAAAGAAVTVAVEQISRRYEDLYYAGQRTRSSITGLLSFEYAARQIGLTAGQARGAVEGFATSLRMSPGLQGLLGSMGVGGGEPADQIRKLIRKLKDSFGEEGYYGAARVGGLFGLDEQTFKQMWDHLEEQEARIAQYKRIVADAGLNTKKMGEDSVRAARAFNELGASLDILGSKILSKLIGPLESATSALSEFLQRLAGGKLIKSGGHDFLSGFTAAIPTLGVWNAWLRGDETGQAASAPPSGAAPAKTGANGRLNRDAVVQFFTARGWSKEQAYGIAANLNAESGFNPQSRGDGGRAYGLAQWHPDRQADFAAWAGHPMTESTADEQMQFIQYELRQGKERAAGNALEKAQSARAAGQIFSYAYERPLATLPEMQSRGATAEAWAKQGATTNNISITINGPMTAETARRGVEAGLEAQQRRQLIRGDTMR